MPRPPVFRARMLGVVVAGGVIGVALRELLLLPFPVEAASGSLVLPTATMVVNLLGSFVLGVVVGRLGDRHPLARAFLGTGVLGGFTTYSAFAVQTATLLGSSPVAGIALALLSVLLGLVAAALGVRLVQRPGAASDDAEAAP
ncbi:MAG: CrcB family protein [Microbacterium sp.]